MNKKSNLTLSTLMLCTSLVTLNVQANNNEPAVPKFDMQQEPLANERAWGLSLGVVIGGILGGPPGAFISAIAGDFIGQSIVNNDEITTLKNNINATEFELKSLKKQHHQHLKSMESAYQQEISNLVSKYEQGISAQAHNIMMSMQFRTGSSDLEPHYKEQVVALAKLLEDGDDLVIDLSGYTDKQGSEDNNYQLSLARVNTVKALLLEHGIKQERIVASAFGETAPLEANSHSEVNYFDRRVVMKVTPMHSQLAFKVEH
ncbi:sortase-associated OmpA-like protein PdsO [Thalassotalea aquiviva]|uniref:sortase-associated OmpA-like protein PdsO n=1 Tax=Thalassotalea aquiviva TaxID=3242415 RepID=UPI00352A9327